MSCNKPIFKGGQNIRPNLIRSDPIKKKSGLDQIGLRAIFDRMQYYQPDRIVVGSGQTRSDLKNRSGWLKKKENT